MCPVGFRTLCLLSLTVSQAVVLETMDVFLESSSNLHISWDRALQVTAVSEGHPPTN